LANSTISGCPIAASSAATTASNDLEDVTLSLSTSSFLIVTFWLLLMNSRNRDPVAMAGATWKYYPVLQLTGYVVKTSLAETIAA
jgi:hypothetical protein